MESGYWLPRGKLSGGSMGLFAGNERSDSRGKQPLITSNDLDLTYIVRCLLYDLDFGNTASISFLILEKSKLFTINFYILGAQKSRSKQTEREVFGRSGSKVLFFLSLLILEIGSHQERGICCKMGTE